MVNVRRLCGLSLAALILAGLSAGGPEAGPVRAEEGFRSVTGPCRFRFPEDHGAHRDHRTEWWYWTGNVADSLGRRYGFQLTFFRVALAPSAQRKTWPEPASAWRTDQVFFAHGAVTDVAGKVHRQAEAISREALGLAGAAGSPAGTALFVGAWSAVVEEGVHRLKADAGSFSLDLALVPRKGPAAHGRGGFSPKGDGPGQASCYYSFTRLGASGTLAVDGMPRDVSGEAWMDHEFSTAPLAEDLAGWDWFALQFSDGSELMVYLLRRTDGSYHGASGATFVWPTGRTATLPRSALSMKILDHWKSPRSGGRYPARWRLRVVMAEKTLDLTVTPMLADQEMTTPRTAGETYWEGNVAVSGRSGNGPVQGFGYAELTGYAKAFGAPM